jgi:hypothetical protein
MGFTENLRTCYESNSREAMARNSRRAAVSESAACVRARSSGAVHPLPHLRNAFGYHFEKGMRWPRAKSLKKLKDSIRDKTRRTNGNSLSTIIANVNRTLKGWFEYFKHAKSNTFPYVDGWVRMRLRSILRGRLGFRGRGRGSDHQRWPNAFFKTMGLFTMTEAHATLCRP